MSRERKQSTSDFHDNDSNPIDVSGHDLGGSNEESQNGDNIKACDSANVHLFIVLRLIITCATRSVLLKFKQKNGQPGDGRQAWLALKTRIRILLASVGEHFCVV